MVITLKQALEIMQTSRAFDIEFVTADKRRKTGGAIRQLTRCRINFRSTKPHKDVRPNSKPRNNYGNATRTVIPEEGHPVDVHLFLILKIDNKDVTLY